VIPRRRRAPPGILLGTGHKERGSPVKVALLGCLENVLVTGLARRYEYFVKRAASHASCGGCTATAPGWWPQTTRLYRISRFAASSFFGGMRDRPMGKGKAGRD
jgi:hypothetical protein